MDAQCSPASSKLFLMRYVVSVTLHQYCKCGNQTKFGLRRASILVMERQCHCVWTEQWECEEWRQSKAVRSCMLNPNITTNNVHWKEDDVQKLNEMDVGFRLKRFQTFTISQNSAVSLQLRSNTCNRTFLS